MNDGQRNYLSMVDTVLAVLAEYNGIVSGNAVLDATVNDVKNVYSETLNTLGVQGQVNKGPTITKRELWAAAATKAKHVSCGVEAYAEDIGDETLGAQIHYSYTALTMGKVLNAIIKMQLIHDIAGNIAIALLAPFNVTGTDLTDLQQAIDTLEAAVPMKRVMVVSASAATAQLPGLLNTQRKQFRKLDNMVRTFKLIDETFVMAYFNARNIINRGKKMQAKELKLEPKHWEVIFGKKFKVGHTFTIRNHSKWVMEAFLTDTPDEVMVTRQETSANHVVNIKGGEELKLVVPKDFGGVFGHWLVVYNPNGMDVVNTTVILAHGKSRSKAGKPMLEG